MSIAESVEDMMNPTLLERALRPFYSERRIGLQRSRYVNLLQEHLKRFNPKEAAFFSSPGRTELCGNHTDHNQGRVLAAAINLDMIAAVSINPSSIWTLYSRDMDCSFQIDIEDCSVREEEKGKTEALMRGIAAGFQALGCHLKGLDISLESQVAVGSGLSSSAALEILLAQIANTFFSEGKLPPLQLARLGQRAENEWFGKPSGLMDQIACAHGGIVSIDFQSPSAPVVTPSEFDFQQAGYDLAVLNCGGGHQDMTEEYAAIPAEMRSVASFFGEESLRRVKREDLLANLNEVRVKAGDRAVLRAIHYFDENRRVASMILALREDRFEDYLVLAQNSGLSSFRFLQNCLPFCSSEQQELALGIALSEEVLRGSGAVRIHGGGFAGTIQLYIPREQTPAIKTQLEAYFGKGSLSVLKIRKNGAVHIQL